MLLLWAKLSRKRPGLFLSTRAFCLQEGMVNVKHRRCAEPNCNTRPAFNWKGQEKGAYCNKHKEKGMINVDKKEPRAGGHAVTQRLA